jgi:hypothetical protein
MKAGSYLILLQGAKLIAIWSAAILCLTATGLAATYRAYPGPSLPREQVAVLKLSHLNAALVDGKDPNRRDYEGSLRAGCKANLNPHKETSKGLCWTGVDRIELLPGKHTITFVFGSIPLNAGTGIRAVHADPITEEVTVEAGKEYKAQRRWTRGSQSGSCVGPNSTCYWSVDFTDESRK